MPNGSQGNVVGTGIGSAGQNTQTTAPGLGQSPKNNNNNSFDVRYLKN
jgi:hypothetical protein